MKRKLFLRWVRAPLITAFAVFSLSAVAAQPTDSSAEDLGKPLPAQALAGYRGGYEVHVSNADLEAQLSNNQAQNNVTGINMVAGQAFSGASGIPTVIQNSGNNVIIQNSTILNVEMR